MRNLLSSKKEILIIVLGALLVGAVTLVLATLITRNVLFIAALPFAAVAFLLMALNIRHMFIFILMTRACLDPVLMQTKIAGGAGGIGALLNLFVVVMAFLMVLRQPEVLKKNSTAIAWMVFLALAALTIFYSPQPKDTFKLLLNLSTYVAVFVVPFFIVKDKKDNRFWIKLILISSVIPISTANLGFITKLEILNADGRLSGFFTHANILAFYTVFIIKVCFYVLRTRMFRLSPGVRLFAWLYILDLFAVLMITQTRSAWISCVAMFLIYGLLKERKVLFVMVLAAGLLFSLPMVRERMADLGQGTGARSGEKLNSWAWRVQLWKNAWPSIQERFLVGHGLGNFSYLSRDFAGYSAEKKWGVPAHNVYVELLAETGIFGLLTYLSIYLTILRKFFRRLKEKKDFLSREAALIFSYVIGYLMASFSDNALYYLSFNWYFWFFLGVVLAGHALEAKTTVAELREG